MWSNEHTGIILCYRQHENVSVGDPKVFANLCYTTQQVSNTSLKIDVTFCVHLIVTKINPSCTLYYVITAKNCTMEKCVSLLLLPFWSNFFHILIIN